MLKLTLVCSLLLFCLCGVPACEANQPSPQMSTVRFALLPGSSAMTDKLIEISKGKIEDTIVLRRDTPGTASGVDYVNSGLAEITIAPSDVAYTAFTSGTEVQPYPHSRLRGMAMLYPAGLHLLVAPGIRFGTLTDLRGKRIAIGTSESGTNLTLRRILPYLGVSLSDIHAQPVHSGVMFRRLADRTLDAGFVLISYPSPAIREVLERTGARLVSIDGPAVRDLREHYPFLRTVVIPADAYGQSEDIRTLGSNWFYVCRDDLSEEVVYRMLTIFFNSLPELSQVQPALRTFAFDRAPESPIPLHPGAARFYRERQLFR